MITSYETGAVLRILDEASPVLRKIYEEVARLEKAIGTAQKRFAELGQTKIPGLNASLTGIEDRLKGIGLKSDGAANSIRTSFGRADTAITDTGRKLLGFGDSFAGVDAKATAAITGVVGNMGRADAAIGTTTSAAEKLKLELQAAGVASRDIPRLPSGGGGSNGGGRTPGGGPSEGKGESGRKAWKEVGVDTGIMGFVGAEEIGRSVEDIVKRGAELVHVQEQMVQGGMKPAEIAQATAAAWKEAAENGMSVVKVMEDIKELRFPLGSTEHAINFTDQLEKMRVVLNSVLEGSGNSTRSAVYEMARAGELKGLQTPEEFSKYFDDMTKVISATGGKVTPKDFMQAMKYGRVASLGWDEEFTTKYLPTLMQSLGPSGAGTAAMSLFGTLAQGHVSKKALVQMEDIGLITDYSKVEYDKQGNAKGFRPGAVANTDEFVRNPALWAQNTLLPMLTKKFGDLGDDTNRLHAAEGLGGLFGNRMSAQAIAEFILRMQSINKDVNLTGQARGIDGARDLLAHDPTAAMNNFRSSWENLLTALGKSSVQSAVDMMNSMAHGMSAIAQFVDAHPEAAKNFIGIASGVAFGLGALAAVAFTAFVPGGIAVVGLATLAGAMVGLIAVNWEKLGLSMDTFHRNIAEMSKAVTEINDFGNRLGDAVFGMINGILDKLRAIPGMSAILGSVRGTEEFGPPMPPALPETHEKTAWKLQHPSQTFPQHEAFGPRLPSGWHPANDDGVLEDRLTRSRASTMHADTMDDGLARMRAGMIDMPSAHAAEGATIPGLNPSAVTGQASTAIAGRLGLPAGIDMSGAIERATGSLGLLQKQEELNVWQFGQLTTSTGIVQTSFDGLNTRATGITGALAPFSSALDAATAKVYGLFGGGAGVGDVGGGSGFTQAAYTTWDSPGSGSGGGAGSGRSMPSGRPHGGATGNFGSGVLSALPAGHVTGSILSRGDSAMAHLLSLGVTREAAAAIVGNAQQESSITGHGPAGDHGTAHGMFQWRFDRFAALQQFAAARGKPWQDENTELAFAVEEAKRRGNAGWLYGHDVYAANQGMKRFEQYGESADGGNFRTRLGNAHMWMGRPNSATVSAGRPAATVSAPPPRKVSPGVPVGGNMTTAMNDARPQQHHIYLDGKKIAQVVTKHQASAMRFPNSMGGPDPHGHYTSPGTPLSDVA